MTTTIIYRAICTNRDCPVYMFEMQCNRELTVFSVVCPHCYTRIENYERVVEEFP